MKFSKHLNTCRSYMLIFLFYFCGWFEKKKKLGILPKNKGLLGISVKKNRKIRATSKKGGKLGPVESL
jgi:hypothetical protein